MLPDHIQQEYTYSTRRPPPAQTVSRFTGLPDKYQDFLHGFIDLAWNKLNKYYRKLDDSPLFAASVILHPTYGISWLEARWKSEAQLVWLRDAKAAVTLCFNCWYGDAEAQGEAEVGQAEPRGFLHLPPAAQAAREDDDPFEGFLDEELQPPTHDGEIDELGDFLRAPRETTEAPIE